MRIPKIYIKDKFLDSSISLFIIGLSFLLFVLMGFMKESIFPHKYFYDSYTIQGYIIQHFFAASDPAYANTAKFYSVLGLTDRYVIIPILSMILYFGILIKVFRELPSKKIKFSTYLVFVFFTIMAMVYLTTFSKDCLVALFIVLPFFFLYKKKWGHFYIIFLMCVYAYFFRQYWFLVAAYFFVFRILFQKKVSLFYILLFLFLSYVCLYFVFKAKMGMNITDIRMGLNEDRIGDKDATTAIVNFIPGSNVISETLNVFITFITLMFPIPLLLIHPSLIYLIVFVCLAFAVLQLRRVYINERKSTSSNLSIVNCLSLLLALLVVQGVFEPDYGSFVRHLSPLYPVMFLLIFPLKSSKRKAKKLKTY